MVSLFHDIEHAAVELDMNCESLIRKAVNRFLKDFHRNKLDEDLQAGYIANAASARAVADDMMGAETDFS